MKLLSIISSFALLYSVNTLAFTIKCSLNDSDEIVVLDTERLKATLSWNGKETAMRCSKDYDQWMCMSKSRENPHYYIEVAHSSPPSAKLQIFTGVHLDREEDLTCISERY